MSDFEDCVGRAVAEGTIDAIRGARAKKAYKRHYDRQKQRGLDDDAAIVQAEIDAKAELARDASARKWREIKRMQTIKRIRRDVDSHLSPSGRPDPGAAPLALIEHREGSKIDSVKSVENSIRTQLVSGISGFLRKHDKNILGVNRNPASMREIVKELHGQSSGSPEAKEMAGAISSAFEQGRQLFNAAGGDIGKLSDYGLPHTHSVEKIRAAGSSAADSFKVWREFVAPLLDWDRIEDFSTGRPFGAPDEAFLKKAYDNITTRGWESRTPSTKAQGASLARSRDDHRFLHFKSGDAWWIYNERFGDAPPFDAVVSHIRSMSRDIALMRVLGPNPKQGLAFAIQHAQKIASKARDPRLESAVSSASVTSRAMLAAVEGGSSAPAHGAWAGAFAVMRGLQTAAALGSATLSSVTDLFTVGMAARSMGMNPFSPFGQAMKLITSSVTREEAASLGYVADTVLNTSSGTARFMGEIWQPEVTRRISDTVLRASGLNWWTDTLRISHQRGIAAHLAAQAQKRFQDLPEDLRFTFERRGFTEADWDAVRAAPLFKTHDGGRLLAPVHFREAATHLDAAARENLATRLQAIFDEQTQYAVQIASVEGRARIVGEMKPGTVGGEMLNSFMQFKSYPITFFLLHSRRAMAQRTNRGMAGYVAAMAAGLTLFGALSIQLKAIAKGEDPRDMTEWRFWAAAFLQGGSLGIFGDFLYGLTSRSGQDIKSNIAGPVFGTLIDAGAIPANLIKDLLTGDDITLGRDVTNFARRNTPGTSLFYARAALDRMLWDQVQLVLDPEAEAHWRRQERARVRQFGNERFWERGELTPDRAPDMGAALGG